MQTRKAENFKSEFAQFLSLPQWRWNWVVHQTFDDLKQSQYRSICQHSWRYFMNGTGSGSALCYGFCFQERGKFGRLHWHALVHVEPNFRGQPTRKQIWSYMFKRYGRSQILQFDPTIINPKMGVENSLALPVADYLTKYVAKESFCDNTWWDFDGFLGGYRVGARRIQDAIKLAAS